MSKTVHTGSLKPHQVITSERFANGIRTDGRTHVGFPDSRGPFEGSESRRNAQFLVTRSGTLSREGFFPGPDAPEWEVVAVRLQDGKLLPGAEVIYIISGGYNEEVIDEVALVGEASISVDIKPTK